MQVIDFDLDGEFVELNQLLKLVGVCDSGGVELRKTAKIRAGQRVRVGGIEIRVA